LKPVRFSSTGEFVFKDLDDKRYYAVICANQKTKKSFIWNSWRVYIPVKILKRGKEGAKIILPYEKFSINFSVFKRI